MVAVVQMAYIMDMRTAPISILSHRAVFANALVFRCRSTLVFVNSGSTCRITGDFQVENVMLGADGQWKCGAAVEGCVLPRSGLCTDKPCSLVQSNYGLVQFRVTQTFASGEGLKPTYENAKSGLDFRTCDHVSPQANIVFGLFTFEQVHSL